MNQNNLDPLSRAHEQWLIDIYNEEFPGLKGYAVRLTRNEVEAENIVGNSFLILAKELAIMPDSFEGYPHAKARLFVIIRNTCVSYLRQWGDTNSVEAVETIPDEWELLTELEKRDLLQHLQPLIDKLPKRLKRVATLFFVKGLTMKQVEQELENEFSKEVIAVYKAQAIGKLRTMVFGKKQTLPPGQYLLILCWLHINS